MLAMVSRSLWYYFHRMYKAESAAAKRIARAQKNLNGLSGSLNQLLFVRFSA